MQNQDWDLPLNIFTEDIYLIKEKGEINTSNVIIEAEQKNPPSLLIEVNPKVFPKQVFLFSTQPSSEEKDLFEKILKALNIDPKNTLQEIYSEEIIQDILTSAKTEKLIIFGKGEGKILPDQLYNPISRGITKILISEPLNILLINIESKKRLWKCLQDL